MLDKIIYVCYNNSTKKGMMTMKRQYQVTLKCVTGQYRPVSVIVTMEQDNNDNLLLNKEQKSIIIKKGIEKICIQRYWGKKDLIKYNYTKVMTREYIKGAV